MVMGSNWRKVKQALGLNFCLYTPQNVEESSPPSAIDRSRSRTEPVLSRFPSDSAIVLSSPSGEGRTSATPTESSSGLRLSKSFSRSFKKTCAICLASIKPGQGHAIFTAECSHTFHFHCIALNVNHGSKTCPICRVKWKEIPFQNPSTNVLNAKSRIRPVDWSRDEMAIARRLPSPRLERQVLAPHASEPGTYDDDEVLDLDHQDEPGVEDVARTGDPISNFVKKIEVATYSEISAIPGAMCHNDFSVLINLKALNSEGQNGSRNENTKDSTETSRAPVDLVTVLDVSGSMAGTKLALLKRAMGFVIQNLGPSDRLSVVAFSSMASRLFHLRKMTEDGKLEAIQSVNSLSSNGGTNISEGLRKGAKVIVDRKWKNPVTSIILLSDGQDTYTVTNQSGGYPRADYKSLLPLEINFNGNTGFRIPVHAFGFGTDHDAAAMHAISELSGGTFSFIETESVIQDAFAQCIGGLLSVVVQEAYLKVECVHQNLRINSIKAGSYRSSMTDDRRTATIHVGDLYADEERDFLVSVDIPADVSADEMSLLKVSCFYKDPITSEIMSLNEPSEVKLDRPATVVEPVLSMEVDRQRNRLRAAEAMGESRLFAERGDLAGAVSVLESCRRAVSETISARAEDRLCISLLAELKEMQERMTTRHAYETSGRAYVLSGLSSHSWQRATARGDSTDRTSLLQSYQTPTMVDMVTRSQTIVFGTSQSRRKLRPAHSFPKSREHK